MEWGVERKRGEGRERKREGERGVESGRGGRKSDREGEGREGRGRGRKEGERVGDGGEKKGRKRRERGVSVCVCVLLKSQVQKAT